MDIDFNLLIPMSEQDRIFPNNITQTSDENKEKYQLRDYQLIQYKILQTDFIRTVQQTVRRITNKILGVKGLRCYTTVEVLYQSD